MDTIEELTKLYPEESFGKAEEMDARVEYERDMAFASWQLRAKALMDEAWASYRQASHVESALREVFKRHEGLFSLEARLALSGELNEARSRCSSLFGVWCALGQLARAEGRNEITPQQEADAFAIVAQLEEVRAETLLQNQAMRRREKEENAQGDAAEGEGA